MPRGALRRTPAWGAILVSFFVGAALIAALIDIPLFARTTVYADSQLLAALVLVRFLVALPVGAVVGGWLTRRVAGRAWSPPPGWCWPRVGFLLMARWDVDSLETAGPRPSRWSSAARVRAGAGPGQRRRPGQHRRPHVHGLASAMVVVARMVGMLVGISALTTIGLRRYYAEQSDLPPVREVCDGHVAVRRVHPAAQGGRHRPGAHRLHRRRGLRAGGRRPGPGAVPARRHPGGLPGEALRASG